LQTPLKDGWGITSNGTHLFVGDSTDTIHILDPTNLKSVGVIRVTDSMGQIFVKWLNELEWVDGTIFANVYTTDCLAQINLETGGVVGWVVLDGLRDKVLESLQEGEAKTGPAAPEVLNGVAFDAKRARLFVTGKLWPKVYQIELRPMYVDSKATDVAGINERIREQCIISPDRVLGR
jgi:glutaminyl-peptide cyclotransferase